MHGRKITYLDKLIHEINGQIHIIGLFAEIMLDSKKAFSEIDSKESLEIIYNSARSLARIVNLLSTATNFESSEINVELKEQDLIGLVNQEVKRHQIRNKENPELRINLNNKVLTCKTAVDELWFKQLLSNLIMNAINHCPQGTIEISTNTFHKDGTKYFMLSVIDEGCGIPEDELEAIFQPLKRGSHSIGKISGSGIGLTIAREVVEAHNGSISAHNNSKGGATFEVLIPLKN
jgi:two-component system sensor histidine kinase ResE